MGIARQTVTAQKSVFITGAQALIEGVLKLPAQLEEISSVLEIAPQLEVSQAQTSAGCVSLEGTAVFTVLYIDKKGTIASFEARCSFRHTVEAEKIAKNLGVKLGDVSSVSENSSQFYGPYSSGMSTNTVEFLTTMYMIYEFSK